MRTFKDRNEDEWKFDLNITSMEHVQQQLGVNMMLDDRLLLTLGESPILLRDVLFVLCKEQADERTVTLEDFGKALSGNSIMDATTALMGELVDFCPSPARREAWKEAQRRTERGDELMAKVLARKFPKMTDEKMEEMMEQVLDSKEMLSVIESIIKGTFETSTSAPESSESTPAASPSSN